MPPQCRSKDIQVFGFAEIGVQHSQACMMLLLFRCDSHCPFAVECPSRARNIDRYPRVRIKTELSIDDLIRVAAYTAETVHIASRPIGIDQQMRYVAIPQVREDLPSLVRVGRIWKRCTALITIH